MTNHDFQRIDQYMQTCMADSAHDKEHIYRVLYVALDIASHEAQVDYDILIAACLLHDIGRAEQFADPLLCHAREGGKKAYDFLLKNGWTEPASAQVRHCIETHRFRTHTPPVSLEAKILFDSDKVDVTGAVGIARTLCYGAQMSEPFYAVGSDGTVSDGSDDRGLSFFGEYKYKLEKLYDHFYTFRGKAIAHERKEAAVHFYNSMLSEVMDSYKSGRENLTLLLTQEEFD